MLQKLDQINIATASFTEAKKSFEGIQTGSSGQYSRRSISKQILDGLVANARNESLRRELPAAKISHDKFIQEMEKLVLKKDEPVEQGSKILWTKKVLQRGLILKVVVVVEICQYPQLSKKGRMLAVFGRLTVLVFGKVPFPVMKCSNLTKRSSATI
uniref:Uncharacterized protein n=1 Tax=Phlegmariurus squarrosus TaxID=73615 RepID=H9M849_PHLSQ|nr:hypothetical protein HusqMp54 [Phlegmariurus squarrosus]AEV55756.1 hypothetical protein HusqMp54 [Phlegmariurus squarrosus]